MGEIASDLFLLAGIFLGVGLSALLLFVAGRSLLVRLSGHRARRSDVEARITAEKAAQYAAQNERLEQRVRELERIVAGREDNLALEAGDARDRSLN